MTMKAQVSVVMSVWNGEPFLREAADSILAQTYGDLEFIVIDDGSTDATPEILGSIRDPRMRVIRQENAGLTVSLNRGIAVAAGRYIARMDADDVSFGDRFAAQVEALQGCPDVVLIGTDAERIDAAGSVIGSVRHLLRDSSIREVYPVGNQFVHGSVMFRREAFDRAGGYDERLRYAQDYDLWWRMMRLGTVRNLPRTLFWLRESERRISSRLGDVQSADRDRIMVRIWNEILGNNCRCPRRPRGTVEDAVPGSDPHRPERRRLYARLLLRMGIGFTLHGDMGRARRYMAKSVLQDPAVSEAWACLVGSVLVPSRLRRRCEDRARVLPLYRTIAGAGKEA